VLAVAEVPAGAYARQALLSMERDPAFGAGLSEAVLRNVVSNESNVRRVVAKVELGEADAGIVYTTDVTASVAPRLAIVPITPAHNVLAEYPIALTASPANAAVARAFVDFVLSPAGQAVLAGYGFQPVN
jgi:molybdate transport system substrate-binding protein